MGLEDIADRLERIAEELDDLVIDQLRMATTAWRPVTSWIPRY